MQHIILFGCGFQPHNSSIINLCLWFMTLKVNLLSWFCYVIHFCCSKQTVIPWKVLRGHVRISSATFHQIRPIFHCNFISAQTLWATFSCMSISNEHQIKNTVSENSVGSNLFSCLRKLGPMERYETSVARLTLS